MAGTMNTLDPLGEAFSLTTLPQPHNHQKGRA
jgi:hypothetical protein